MSKQRDPGLLEALRKLDFGDWLEREGHVQFKKKAGNNWLGLALYRGESNPSFTYTPDRGDGYGLYHDHTGNGDTFLGFCTKEMGMTFPDAKKLLFELTGVVEERDPEKRKKLRAAQEDRQKTIETLTAYAFWCHHNLDAGARDYLTMRGFTTETVDRFRLGLGGSVRDWMTRDGISERWVIRAGILSRSQRGSLYETMMHRITLPYWEGDRCVFMTGRNPSPEPRGPKYRMLGTTQSDRGISPAIDARVLYNQDAIARARREGKPLAVVEGQLDAIAIEQAGWPAVALSGLGGTTGRIDPLVKKSEGLSLFLVPDIDPNGSGVKAMSKLGELLVRKGREVSVVILGRIEHEQN